MPQRRRVGAGKTFKPAGIPVPVMGLSGMSVLDAAAVDEEDISWRVAGTTPVDRVYHGGRSGLIALMELLHVRLWTFCCGHFRGLPPAPLPPAPALVRFVTDPVGIWLGIEW